GTQFKVLRGTLIRFGANDRDARSLSVTVSYVNTFGDIIVPKVIDVTIKSQRCDELVRGSIVDVELAISSAHKQFLEFRNVHGSLGVRHSSNCMYAFFG